MSKMLKMLLPILGVTVATLSNAQSNPALCNYGHETIPDVVCFGPANLDGTTVTGDVFVTGPVTMTNANVNSVEIMGVLNSSSSIFNGSVKIDGPLNDVGSKFYHGITIATNEMSLNNSRVGGGITEKSQGENAVLKMINRSLVIGNVDFSAYPGVVELDSSSTVSGQIINGTKVPIR